MMKPLPSPESQNRVIDLEAIRSRLEAGDGKRFWRSLEELADTTDFQQHRLHEFPHDPEKSGGEVTRRDALKLMAASAALAGLSACTRLPRETIVPYVQAVEEMIPGKPLFFATASTLNGIASGLLVESHMGRPTKIEGSPEHPSSLGATDIFAQASVLTLYDPDRSQVVVHNGRFGSWSEFLDILNSFSKTLAISQGDGFRVLTGTVTSPSLGDQLHSLLTKFPKAKWHQYEPVGRDHVRAGAILAFGEYVETLYRFDRADTVLALDSDFLATSPGRVRYARDFADKRRVQGPQSSMNRLYVIEAAPSITGVQADHRLSLKASEVESFARALAEKLGIKTGGAPNLSNPKANRWIEAISADLEKHRGASIILAGEQQPPAVHALAHAINNTLGNANKTVVYTEPLEQNPVAQMQSLQQLVADINAGQVDTLLILEANPVYTAPPDLSFRDALLKVNTRIHLGLYDDETAELCPWHIPAAHSLESWGDPRAYDGTVSTVQPLIAPLYDGRTPYELLTVLLGHPGRIPHDIVHDYWKTQKGEKDFEVYWQVSLHDGVMAGTAFSEKKMSLVPDLAAHLAAETSRASVSAGGLEIIFRPDPTIWDGQFSNNGWLQELPKPLTHLTWENAAMVSPATAQRLGVSYGDGVELSYRGRTVRAPVWIVPGQADDSVVAHLGYGRKRAGRIGTDIGFNAYALRTSDQPWFGTGLEVRKTGERYALATTQYHSVIGQGSGEVREEAEAASLRELVRVAPLNDFRNNPNFAQDPTEETTKAASLYPGYKYEGNAWGMSIDLNTCIGCNACVVACQAENNIPVVGKEQVIASREMHWIRVDTYFQGALDNPRAYNQVVLCMHCENAPCEYVCPVAATVHSPEGLNEMIYNRCVGTRYCSNNCPYKVRRFNFKLYSDWTTSSLYSLRNPNVSVRSRGVMEKCTYCVQRINAKKIEAEEQDRSLRDGEIQTACQQVCPARAIVFGNINDPQSRVSELKAQPQSYALLTELNTRPRTTYLAKLTNPNPELRE